MRAIGAVFEACYGVKGLCTGCVIIRVLEDNDALENLLVIRNA
jgi:hypothetical protein